MSHDDNAAMKLPASVMLMDIQFCKPPSVYTLTLLTVAVSSTLAAEGEVLSVSSARYECCFERQSAALTVRDKATGEVWRCLDGPAMSLSIPEAKTALSLTDRDGVLSAGVAGKELRFGVRGLHVPGSAREIAVSWSVIAAEDRVRVVVPPPSGLPPGVECCLEVARGLGYAPASSEGCFVLPYGCGDLVPFGQKRRIEKQQFIYEDGWWGPNMAVFGLVTGHHGVAGVVKTPMDAKLRVNMAGPGDEANYVAPVWVFESERTEYPREVDYFFATPCDYVTIAKIYRREVQHEGRFATLGEKLRTHPQAAALPGAVLWKRQTCFKYPHTPEEHPRDFDGVWHAEDLVRAAKRLGFDRLMIYAAGWNFGDYDRLYPKRLPPNPTLGGEEGFRRAAAAVRALGQGYCLSVHDNYIDTFKDSPEWNEEVVIKRRDGSLQPGFAFTCCSLRKLAFARRDLPKIRELTNAFSLYIDVEGAIRLYDCFDPRHPMTRRDDARLRRELLAYARDLFGSVATETGPNDYLADIANVGYAFAADPSHDWPERPDPPAKKIPLFQLVWHDAVINFLYPWDEPAATLMTALYGCAPRGLSDAYLRISKELRESACSEMIAHQFVTDQVQTTQFADGTSVWANFGETTYETENGLEVPPRDFITLKHGLRLSLLAPDGRLVQGRPTAVEVQVRNYGSREVSQVSVLVQPGAEVGKLYPLSAVAFGRLRPGGQQRACFRAVAPTDAPPCDSFVVLRCSYRIGGERAQAVQVGKVAVRPSVSVTAAQEPWTFDARDATPRQSWTLKLQSNVRERTEVCLRLEMPAGWETSPADPQRVLLNGLDAVQQLQLTVAAGQPGPAAAMVTLPSSSIVRSPLLLRPPGTVALDANGRYTDEYADPDRWRRDVFDVSSDRLRWSNYGEGSIVQTDSDLGHTDWLCYRFHRNQGFQSLRVRFPIYLYDGSARLEMALSTDRWRSLDEHILMGNNPQATLTGDLPAEWRGSKDVLVRLVVAETPRRPTGVTLLVYSLEAEGM